MRKKAGIIKRMSCICLVFLLSINSFAAIVSDNDGAAFITKAEFDALRNNFQSQIDNYNQSIDSKIDGAIASYLAGIKLSTEQELTCLWTSTDGALSLTNNTNECKWNTNDMSGGVVLTGFCMQSNTGGSAGIGACANLSKFVTMIPYGLNIGLRSISRGTNYSNTDSTNNTSWTTAEYTGFVTEKDVMNGGAALVYDPNGNWTIEHGGYGWQLSMHGGYGLIYNSEVSNSTNIWGAAQMVRSDKGNTFGCNNFNAEYITMTQQIQDTAYPYAISLTDTLSNTDTRKTAYNPLYWCRDIDSVKDFQCANSTTGMTALTTGIDGRTFKCYHVSRTQTNWTTLYNANGTSSSNFIGKPISDAYATASSDPCYYFSNDQRNNPCKNYYPFVGYVNYKSGVPTAGLYTKQWDSLVPTLITQEGSALVNKTSSNHLKLSAGLPICNVQKDGAITMTVRIVDKNQLSYNTSTGVMTHPATNASTQTDHVLWIKMGSVGTVEPWDMTGSEGGILRSSVTVNGSPAQTVTNAGNCGIKIPANTTCEIKFTPIKNKHIFVKWSKTDSTNLKLGGGVLYIDKIIQVIDT